MGVPSVSVTGWFDQLMSDTTLKPLLALHVGPFSPPFIKHLKEVYVAQRGSAISGDKEAIRKILVNFVNFKKEKLSIKPSPKEIVLSLYNTLKLTSEYILKVHKERYEENTRNLFTNEVERAWVLSARKPVLDEMHEGLLWIERVHAACVSDGANPTSSDLLLLENRVKHLLRGFDPSALPAT